MQISGSGSYVPVNDDAMQFQNMPLFSRHSRGSSSRASGSATGNASFSSTVFDNPQINAVTIDPKHMLAAMKSEKRQEYLNSGSAPRFKLVNVRNNSHDNGKYVLVVQPWNAEEPVYGTTPENSRSATHFRALNPFSSLVKAIAHTPAVKNANITYYRIDSNTRTKDLQHPAQSYNPISHSNLNILSYKDKLRAEKNNISAQEFKRYFNYVDERASAPPTFSDTPDPSLPEYLRDPQSAFFRGPEEISEDAVPQSDIWNEHPNDIDDRYYTQPPGYSSTTNSGGWNNNYSQYDDYT